jgi:hypothetical protein
MMISVSFYPVQHERPVLVRVGNDTYITSINNNPSHLIEGEEDDDI